MSGRARGHELPPWLRPLAGRLSPAVKVLVLVETLVFVAYLMSPPVRALADRYLVLGPGLLGGMVWQPVTTLFVHDDFLAFALHLLGLWFIGAGIETTRGRGRFLLQFFLPAVLGGGATLLAGQAMRLPGVPAGCGLAILSLFVAFGVQYGRTPARVLGGLVLEARKLAGILVGFSLLIALIGGAFHVALGMVLACAVAWLVAGGDFGVVLGRRAAAPARPRYRVLEGGRRTPLPERPRSARPDGDRYLN